MKTEKKKTLRGSVLFTVVCVMALLIIFLTGTLALASAAGNRAHRSYSVSQASYTARTAIESFTQAMQRDKGIEAAVEEMGSGGYTVLHPKVVIPDKTLGEIGYWDGSDWVPDRIEITPIGSGTYSYYDKDGNGPTWNEVQGVKVTATCKVGREYETVSAYIQKSPSTATKNKPGGINGLQEAGGNSFPNGALITGGLGVGVSKTQADVYCMHNKQQIDTTLMFVNSNLVCGTSSNQIHIHKPLDKDAAKPYSQIVVKGDLLLRNDSFIMNEYEMTESYTQKEVPYLYVDGIIAQTPDSTSTVKLVDGNNSPFNVFAGTLHPSGPISINADLYLMDKAGGTIEAPYADRDGSAQSTKEYEKGVNYIGPDADKGGNALYEWSKSVVQRTETTFNSSGGNIYCMGDLVLQQATIRGDVRVEGNCTINNGVTIYGDLVVGGKLTFGNNNINKIVKGKIYNSNNDGGNPNMDGIKDGYTYHENELYPGYIEVQNVVYENTPVPDVEPWSDKKQDHDPWGFELTYPDGTVEYLGNDENNSHKTIYVLKDTETYWEEVPYYRTDEKGFDDTNTIVTDKFSRYAVEPDGTILYEKDENGQPKINGEGNQIPVKSDDDQTYYKKPDTVDGEYQRVGRNDAVGTYYLDPSGKIVSEGDARNSVKSGDILPYETYVKDHGSAYPTNMTREAIYGKTTAAGFEAAPSETKIVKTLQEVRKDLKFDEDGNFDGSYYNDLPEEYGTIDELPYAYSVDQWNNASLNSDVLTAGNISTSCIIGRPDSEDNAKLYVPNDITIKAKDEIWIVIQNMNLEKHIYIDEASAKVNFLFVGDNNSMNNGEILSTAFKDNMTVRYDMDWGIEFYATEGARLELGNQCLFTGTFKAPTLTIRPGNAGKHTINYYDEYGNTQKINPVVVGSALVDHVEIIGSSNEFSVVNTGNGGSGAGTTSFKGTFGWYDVSYFMGV